MKAAYTVFIIVAISILPFVLRCSGGGGDIYDSLTSTVTAQDSIPQALEFTDSDPDEDQLKGDLFIKRAANERKITTYRVYWGSGESTRLSGESVIASFSADGTDHTLTFAADTAVPSGATHILVYTEGDEGETVTPKAIDFRDLIVRRVAEINTTGSSNPSGFTIYNNELYFAADDGSGLEVWKTDGTAAGTIMVHNINAEANPSPSAPSNFTVFNSMLYFSASESNTINREVWYTDGTTAASIEINPAGSANPDYFAVFNGILYFSATDGTDGIQLWSSGGSTASPITIGINLPIGIKPMYLKEYNSKLYFTANNGINGLELWETDGTEPNTTMVVPEIYTGGDAVPWELTVYNGLLFFSAADSAANGTEFWSYDGTTFQMIENINTTATISSSPGDITIYNGRMYFRADNGTEGSELWASYGTTASTVLFGDINSGSSGSHPASLRVYNNRLYFRANDGTHGEELWLTDGTSAGTKMVCDIVPGANSFSPSGLTVYNGRLYFGAKDASGDNELWVLYYK
jgi:ELWxxDGT repeat protein